MLIENKVQTLHLWDSANTTDFPFTVNFCAWYFLFNIPITLEIVILQVVHSRTLADIYRKQRIPIGFVNLCDNHKTSAQKGVKIGFVNLVDIHKKSAQNGV